MTAEILTPSEQAMELIKLNPKISAEEISNVVGVPVEDAQAFLNQNNGLVNDMISAADMMDASESDL